MKELASSQVNELIRLAACFERRRRETLLLMNETDFPRSVKLLFEEPDPSPIFPAWPKKHLLLQSKTKEAEWEFTGRKESGQAQSNHLSVKLLSSFPDMTICYCLLFSVIESELLNRRGMRQNSITCLSLLFLLSMKTLLNLNLYDLTLFTYYLIHSMREMKD